MVITIHKTDGSPPARAVLMAVEYLGLNVDFINVNLGTNDHITPEYLKKNPIHTVPLLEDGEFIIADSHVIITYLVSKYGGDLQTTLYPSDLKERAKIDHRLYLDGTILFPRLLAIVKSVLNENAPGPDAKQLEEVVEAYGFVEKFLEQSKFLAGDQITLADISAVSTVSSLNALVPIEGENFPRIIEWWNILKAEKWYQKANVPGLTLFENNLKGTMERNSNNS